MPKIETRANKEVTALLEKAREMSIAELHLLRDSIHTDLWALIRDKRREAKDALKASKRYINIRPTLINSRLNPILAEEIESEGPNSVNKPKRRGNQSLAIAILETAAAGGFKEFTNAGGHHKTIAEAALYISNFTTNLEDIPLPRLEDFDSPWRSHYLVVAKTTRELIGYLKAAKKSELPK